MPTPKPVKAQSHSPAPPPPDVVPTQTQESENRGRPPKGLYPHMSRTHLATVTGLHLSSIANILQGKTKVGLEDAVVMAADIGVSVEEFSKALVEQQEKWQERHVAGAVAKTRAKRAGKSKSGGGRKKKRAVA